MKIVSKDNQLVKKTAALKNKKERIEQGLFIVEGYHLCKEAYDNKQLAYVMLTSEASFIADDIPMFVVSDAVIKKLSSTFSPQPIIGVCYIKQQEIKAPQKILLLDDISDPGNLGTIIRTACALGVDLIVASFDTVDLYNDKVIRSSQGALFKMPYIVDNLKDVVKEYHSKEYPIYASCVDEGIELGNVEKSEKFLIIVGNEARGVSQELIALSDYQVTITMKKMVESLNVSIATAIILYEFLK